MKLKASLSQKNYVNRHLIGLERCLDNTGNIPIIFEVNSQMTQEQLLSALQILINENEVFRSRYFLVENELYQEIIDELVLTYEEYQIASDCETDIKGIIDQYLKRCFSIENAEFLYRISIFTTPVRSFLVLCINKTICDFQSRFCIIDKIYRNIHSVGVQKNSAVDYIDFAEWQNDLDEEYYENAKLFWESKIRQDLLRPNFVGLSKVDSSENNSYTITIDSKIVNNVSVWCKYNGFSQKSFYLSVVKFVASRIWNNNSVLIHFETDRAVDELKETIGLCSSTVPLIGSFDNSIFSDLNKIINEEIVNVESNSILPLEIVCKNQNSELNGFYITDPSIIFRFYEYQAISGNQGIQVSNICTEHVGNCLVVEIIKSVDDVKLTIYYNTQYHLEEIVKEYVHYIDNAISALIAGDKVSLNEVSALNDTQIQTVMKRFNQNEFNYKIDQTVAELLEAQFDIQSNQIAISEGGKNYSYMELRRSVFSIVKKLKEFGIKSGDYVLINGKHSALSIMGICAIVISGGVYVPVDFNMPKERMDFIIKDCHPLLALYDGGDDVIFDYKIPVIDLNSCFDEDINNEYSIEKADITSDSLIYIMYTSGTTGNPKGVMIEHKNVVRLVHNASYVQLNEKTNLLLTGSLSFDAATFEIWGVLLNGGCLHIVDNGVLLNEKRLKSYINENRINTMWLTAALFNQLVDNDVEIFDRLNNLLIGGEKLSEKHVNKLLSWNVKINLINGYGPTETTTFATTHIIEEDCKYNTIPIGKPITNTSIYVINKQHICGIGMIGEICIAGDGVGRGYLNNEKLTKEKFVVDKTLGKRIYKTGDLGRWLPDGVLEYIGRNDNQVKIRGFRIETSEIESVIKKYDYIDDVAVTVKELKNEKYICAYYVSRKKIDVSHLKEYLRNCLPVFMLPTYYFEIDRIPLTSNGKKNYTILPFQNPLDCNEYIEPRNTVEEKLQKIFSDNLYMEKISVKANFFEMGGHSLKAAKILNEIERGFGKRISFKTFFENPTIEYLASRLENTNIQKEYQCKAINKDFYQLSPGQRRVYTGGLYDDTGIAYNVNYGMWVKEKISYDCLKTTLKKLFDLHEGLKTAFIVNDGEIVQKIFHNVNPIVDYEEIAIATGEEAEEQLKKYVYPFDLSNPPLLRVKLVKNSIGNDILLFSVHHIIADGMSINILIKDFIALYHNETVERPETRYIDYSEWINHVDLSDQEKYWKEFVGKKMPTPNFPTDYSRLQIRTYKGDQKKVSLGKELKEKIESFCKKNAITENVFFLTVFHILIHKYTGEDEIVVGSPVNARTIKDAESIIGMFVNVLGTKSHFEKNIKVCDLLKQISESTKGMLNNQDYPLDALISSIIGKLDTERNSLFNLMFSYQNIVNVNTYNDMIEKPIHFTRNTSKFDMTLTVTEEDAGYEVDIEYLTALFSSQTIMYILRHYVALLENIVNDSKRCICEISILDKAEEILISDTFAYGKKRFEKPETIYSAFKKSVQNYPEKKALSKGNDYLTYKMLDEKSDIVAHYLIERGVKRQDKVLIIAEKNFGTIITLLACVKLSAIYIMVDSEYPEERVDYIINQTSPKAIVVCDGREIEKAILFSQIDLMVNQMKTIEYRGNVEDTLNLIYTSGTTGNPKGVIIPQKGVLRLVENPSYVVLNKNSVILQASSLSFDACAFEIWGALLNGGTLCLAEKEIIINPIDMKRVIDENAINTLFLTTSLFNYLVASNIKVFERVKSILFGGESASESSVSLFKQKYPSCYLCNMYGPTEASTYTTYFKIKDEVPKRLPIGKPINDTSVFIIKDDTLCGIGIIGEICIGGIGISKGYYGMPEVTKEKFISLMIGGKKEYLYRSGDLGRWLPDGNVEFYGRNDNQIKINGHRVELDEISNILMKKAEIKDVVTVVKTVKGNRLICTYFTSDNQQDKDGILEYLSRYLTQNMMPAIVMQIPRIPLTINGKVDTKMLPEIDFLTRGYTDERPTDEFELKILGIFEDVLNISPISMNDNFYELGGDSIKAIRLIAKLREMGLVLSARDILKSKVISRILACITKDTEVYEQNAITGYFDFTPIQSMFFTWNLSNRNHFNQSVVLNFKNGLNVTKLKKVIKTLIEYHDILRSVTDDKRMFIRAVEDRASLEDFYSLRTIDLAEDNWHIIDSVSTEVQSGLNIKQGPMLGIALFNIANEKTYCMLCIHHLLVDGISWRVLIDDFIHSYYGKALAPKTASYKDWSAYLIRYWKKHDMQEEIKYWSHIALLAEKDDWSQYRDGNGIGNITISESIEKDYTDNLGKASSMYNTDVKTILLTALGIGVHKWINKDKVVISLEGHGREILDENIDVSRTIGWFTSIYPFSIEYQSDIRAAIIATKENLKHIPKNGIGYGILHQHNQIDMKEEPEICFNYLGEWAQYDNEDFCVIKRTLGENISSDNRLINPISINAQIIENQLEVSIILDTSKYSTENVRKLLLYIIQAIKEVEACCLNQEQVIKTASDYDKDLSAEALEEIYNLF